MSSSSAPLSTPEGPGSGHWVAEELLAALTEFLAPYREGGGGSR